MQGEAVSKFLSKRVKRTFLADLEKAIEDNTGGEEATSVAADEQPETKNQIKLVLEENSASLNRIIKKKISINKYIASHLIKSLYKLQIALQKAS